MVYWSGDAWSGGRNQLSVLSSLLSWSPFSLSKISSQPVLYSGSFTFCSCLSCLVHLLCSCAADLPSEWSHPALKGRKGWGQRGVSKASGTVVGNQTWAPLFCWQNERQILSSRPVGHLESSLAAVPEMGFCCMGACPSRQQKAMILEYSSSAGASNKSKRMR